MAGPPFDRMTPGQRQVSASLINDALTEIERLGMFYSGDGAQAALQAAGGLPPRILARITATDGGSPPKYSWSLMRNNGTGSFTADPIAASGTPTFNPRVEISGRTDVPVDGSAVVEAWPSIGAEQFEFAYGAAAGGGGGGGGGTTAGILLEQATASLGPAVTAVSFSGPPVWDNGPFWNAANPTRITIPAGTGEFCEIGYSGLWSTTGGNNQQSLALRRSGGGLSSDNMPGEDFQRQAGGNLLWPTNFRVGRVRSLFAAPGDYYELVGSHDNFAGSGIPLTNISFWLTRLAVSGGGGGGGGFTGTIGGP